MANREKERRDREFDLRSFLVWVIVLGALVAGALWLVVTVRGHRMLPPPPNREPHSQPGHPGVEALRRRWAMPGDSLYADGQFTGPIHSAERVS